MSQVVRLIGSLLASSVIASLFVACSGKTLDVGAARQAGVAGDGESPAAEAGAIEGGAEVPPPMPAGLAIDDTPCSVIEEGGGAEWPSWSLNIQADCGSLGLVRLVAQSNASVPYPQSCSFVTGVYLGMDAEGDAGTLYYEARAGRGSCRFDSGPTLEDPATGIAFTATAVHAFDPARSHRLSYRASNAP